MDPKRIAEIGEQTKSEVAGAFAAAPPAITDDRLIRYCDSRRAHLLAWEKLQRAEAILKRMDDEAEHLATKEMRLLATVTTLEKMQRQSQAANDQPTSDKLGVERCTLEAEYRSVVIALQQATIARKGAEIDCERVRAYERLRWDTAEADWIALCGFDAPLAGPEPAPAVRDVGPK